MNYVRCIHNRTLWQDDPADTYDPLLIVGHVYKVAPPQANDGDEWLRIFGEDGEDYLYPASYFEPFAPEMTALATAPVATHLPPDLKRILRAEALEKGTTVSALLRELIEERLDLPVAA